MAPVPGRPAAGWRRPADSVTLEHVTTDSPALSVVIPTYNRCVMLRQTLDSLVAQRFPAAGFEVIVADDGSSDQTAGVAAGYAGRLRLRYCHQDDRGYRAAAARNGGARLATAPVLAFLDTGTLAGPGFVAGHVAAHAGGALTAVLGYCYGYRPLDDMTWLTESLAALGPERTVQRFGGDPRFTDVRHGDFAALGFDLGSLVAPWLLFWSMNFSVSATAFWRVGGFDEDYRTWGGEDTELGYRLHRDGARFGVSRDAWAIELPHERRLKGNRQHLKRNYLRFLAKHCEPMVEIACSAHLRDQATPVEADSAVLAAWAREAAGVEVAGELAAAAAGLPAGATVAVFGCGPAVPASLPPAILLDFDRDLLARALAAGVHTGYHLIGIRTPLRAGSVDVVIVTSRLRGVWDRWGGLILAEAHRVGQQVRGPLAAALPGRIGRGQAEIPEPGVVVG
jgi:glycosyltransferase involved in cell wall biosynthesis